MVNPQCPFDIIEYHAFAAFLLFIVHAIVKSVIWFMAVEPRTDRFIETCLDGNKVRGLI